MLGGKPGHLWHCVMYLTSARPDYTGLYEHELLYYYPFAPASHRLSTGLADVPHNIFLKS